MLGRRNELYVDLSYDYNVRKDLIIGKEIKYLWRVECYNEDL